MAAALKLPPVTAASCLSGATVAPSPPIGDRVDERAGVVRRRQRLLQRGLARDVLAVGDRTTTRRGRPGCEARRPRARWRRRARSRSSCRLEQAQRVVGVDRRRGELGQLHRLRAERRPRRPGRTAPSCAGTRGRRRVASASARRPSTASGRSRARRSSSRRGYRAVRPTTWWPFSVSVGGAAPGRPARRR